MITLSFLFLHFSSVFAATGNVSTTDKYAWSENSGWISFRTSHAGGTVHGDHLSGYAWHENIGWIKMGVDAGGPYSNSSQTNWGVNRNPSGALSGYAWSEAWGWINFSPTHGGVTADTVTGYFDGLAWGENIGWIRFKNPTGGAVSYCVAFEYHPPNVSGSNKYAWSENMGWLNFNATHEGMTALSDHLTGYAWQENIGWIKLGADSGGPYANSSKESWGVNRDSGGSLNGYAWSETWGWINFSPSHGGVTISPSTGALDGWAWGENLGWISFQSPEGALVSYGVDIASYTLNLLFSGTGSGMVASDPPKIACNTSCSAPFEGSSHVALNAAPSTYSLFSGWSGNCGGSSGCMLIMDGNKSVTATFAPDSVHYTKIDDGGIISYYQSIQEAYNAASASNVIRLWGTDFLENVNCNLNKEVTLDGGYDEAYTVKSGMTTLRGTLQISSGTVNVDGLVISP